MVIGNGLVAKSLYPYKNNNNYLIFASGVSNSTCTDIAEYQREKKLLINSVSNYPNSHLVYFSTCSIYDPDLKNSAYVKHKLKMEKFIRNNYNEFLILRVSNLVGKSSNPNTIINYIYNSINESRHMELWKKSYRNILDIEDFSRIVSYIIDNKLFLNEITNIANPYNYSILSIVNTIENFLNKKANYDEINWGNFYSINIDKIKPYFSKMNVSFGEKYLLNCLRKYYYNNK